MPHNGGRSQGNLGFVSIGYAAPFINILKSAQAWALSGGCTLADFSSDGYPTGLGGCNTVAFGPYQTQRPGNWIMDWVGDGVMLAGFTSTIISGSLTGVNGRCVMLPVDAGAFPLMRFSLGITSFNASNPITQLRFYHEDDEDALNAGEVFSPYFLQRMREANFGVDRFLDWQGIGTGANGSTVRYWADRKPATYAYWNGENISSHLFAGTTGHSGDAYTIAAPPTWPGLVDKAAVVVTWDASASGFSPTLDVGGTGAKVVRKLSGDSVGANSRPTNGATSTLIYDAVLDCWLKDKGDLDGSTKGLNTGIPPEIFVQLCEEVGAHLWVCQPYLTCDPITDYMTEFATYCAGRASAGWMIPRYEPPNELWNSAAAFLATRYGWNKASAYWATSTDSDNFYGKVASVLGQAISGVYGNDRTKYQMMCGVQQQGSLTPTDRLESTKYVAVDGGSAAKNWVTHLSPSTYTFPTIQDVTDLGYEYQTATVARRAEIIDEAMVSNFEFAETVAARFDSFQSWGAGLGVSRIAPYEGDVSLEPPTANHVAGISAITKAAQAQVTISTTTALANPVPPVGSSVTFSSSVGGMTQIRGLTGTVLSRVGQNITVDIDSTAFSTYTSGGSVSLGGSLTYVSALLAAIRIADAYFKAGQDCLHLFADHMEFPSLFDLSGAGPWAALYDSIYGEISDHKFRAHVLFNARRRSGRLTATA